MYGYVSDADTGLDTFDYHLCTRDAANGDATDGKNSVSTAAENNMYFVSGPLSCNKQILRNISLHVWCHRIDKC